MSRAQRLAEHDEILPVIDYSLDDIHDFKSGSGPSPADMIRH